VFPEAAWQRCQFHFSRNIIDKAPKKYQAGLAGELQEMVGYRTFFIIVMGLCLITFIVTYFIKIDPEFGKRQE